LLVLTSFFFFSRLFFSVSFPYRLDFSIEWTFFPWHADPSPRFFPRRRSRPLPSTRALLVPSPGSQILSIVPGLLRTSPFLMLTSSIMFSTPSHCFHDETFSALSISPPVLLFFEVMKIFSLSPGSCFFFFLGGPFGHPLSITLQPGKFPFPLSPMIAF